MKRCQWPVFELDHEKFLERAKLKTLVSIQMDNIQSKSCEIKTDINSSPRVLNIDRASRVDQKCLLNLLFDHLDVY